MTQMILEGSSTPDRVHQAGDEIHRGTRHGIPSRYCDCGAWMFSYNAIALVRWARDHREVIAADLA